MERGAGFIPLSRTRLTATPLSRADAGTATSSASLWHLKDAEMADLRGFTRDLLRQMEIELENRLDWIAVDHHNTGHPHTHILLRGVTEARLASGRRLTKSFPAQRCWVHKTVNVLDKVPLSVQANMKNDLREVYWRRTEQPPKRRSTSSPRNTTPSTAGRSNTSPRTASAAVLLRLPCRALGSPAHDQSHRERVRHRAHRTVRTKGSLSSTTARLMVFKLVVAASKTWRRLKGTNQLPKVIAGVKFNDGIEVIQVPANHAA